MQDRAVLAGIEVTPAALGLMIVQHALVAALRALPPQVRRVFQVDVDFLSVEGQLDTIDPLGAFAAENLSVKLSVLHGQPPAPILA